MRELRQLVIDVGISIGLFICATLFSVWIQAVLTPQIKWFYGVWFVVGMLPCLYYMRFRGVATFDRWDVLAFSPMPILVGVNVNLFDQPFNILASVVLILFCVHIRHYLPARKSGSESASPNINSAINTSDVK
jgi:hypothetical protein